MSESSQPSEVLSRQVRHWREERNLSAQALANRLAEIGSDLDRRTVSKIENGTRGVSLDEWLQLAHALSVPPPLLFLDLRAGGEVAIAPGAVLNPWVIWDWVTGDIGSPVPHPDGSTTILRFEEFTRSRAGLDLYRQEIELTPVVTQAQRAVRSAEYAGDQAGVREAKAAEVEALRRLAEVIDRMVEYGIVPPRLPAEWAEKIRSLGLSKHPGSLAVFGQEVAGGGPDQAG